ncbi:MAG: DUF4476 domain-containing protein [Flavobacteriales bacterium]|nr:DUF4476 domain-containing protein [Flavobacteriales bacterium]
MKKSISLFAFLYLFIIDASSQNNDLVIFSDSPNPFYLILNGISQNDKAVTNVKVVDLQTTNNSVKILFEDNSINPILKTIYFDTINTQYSYRIISTKKKGYKLRGFDRTPKAYVPTNNSVPTIVYKTVNAPAPKETVVVETVTTNTTINNSNESVNMNMGVNEDLETGGNVSMNVGINDNSAIGGNVSMNVGVNDNSDFGENVNFNMNVNVNGGNAGISGTSEDGAENVNINMNLGINDDVDFDDDAEINVNVSGNAFGNGATSSSSTTTTTTTTTSSSDWGGSSYESSSNTNTSVSGCNNPVSNIEGVLGAIENESFKDDKLMIAKQATKSKCLTVSQIKLILNKFSFEDNKLTFAKYAYDRTYDQDNYYQINESFTYSSTKSELNEYIENK